MSITLTKYLNKQRVVDQNRLDALKAMGIHPEFLEKCEEMFEECSATLAEVIGIGDEIQAANDELVSGIELLNYKRKVGNYKNFIDHAV